MKIVPNNKPNLSRAELFSTYAWLKRLNIHEAEKDKLCVIMIPGYYGNLDDKPGNSRGIYDDAIVVLSPSTYATFNANSDPSAFRAKTKNQQGMATLKPGIYPYRLGNHGISKPGGGYPAFRPATPGERLPVWRDGDEDKDAYGVAINIHRGSYNGTSSAGCQTIYPEQWEAFYSLVKSEMKRYNQKTFNLIKLAA